MKCSAVLALFIALLLAGFGAPAHAGAPAELCPETSKNREWSPECFEPTRDGKRIKKEYRKKVVFGGKAFAAIVLASPPDITIVNRKGVVVNFDRSRLDELDFDFEPAEAEVGRFGYLIKTGSDNYKFKCGYYRRADYQTLVPPIYDACDYFRKDRGLVCIGCKNFCESGDCHQSNFAGGEGLIITDKNEVLKRFALPELPLCEGESDKDAVSKTGQKCRPRAPNPFNELM